MNWFSTFIVLRIIIVLLLAFAGFYFILETSYWLLAFWFFLFSSLGIYELIRYLEKIKLELHNFLISIRQNDFSLSHKRSMSKRDQMLYEAYNIITEEFQKVRSERESNYHFLQAVIENSGVALIGYEIEKEKVTLLNEAAKELFKKPFLNTLNGLDQVDKELTQAFREIASGSKRLIKLLLNNQLLNLSLVAKELVINEKPYKLVAIQNIKSELDEKELESWQKLIRVLTHEIKNSVIPISTLSEVINDMIIDEQGAIKNLGLLSKDELEDIRLGMKTVAKRSKGLVSFVDSYGKLARVPEPRVAEVKVDILIDEIINLMRNELKKANVQVRSEVTPGLKMKIDASLIEQVLINLIKNAKEAVEGINNAEIVIMARKEPHHILISVADNGPGIEPEVLENIFIPFYTTKKEGSGIGLSLSRQIMRAHGGSISVYSSVGNGTTFQLKF